MNAEWNIVDLWLRKDPVRWLAGAFAGLFAAIIIMVFAMLYCKSHGVDIWAPLKFPAIPVLGGAALEVGFQIKAIVLGGLMFVVLALVLGVFYAHMTAVNHMGALFGVGITWGVFSWIFIGNLFSSSFREMFVVDVPKNISFLAWVIFGLSLMSVSFFDKKLRR